MSSMHNPAHPGEVLREYLPEGVSIGEVAKRLGVTRQALSALPLKSGGTSNERRQGGFFMRRFPATPMLSARTLKAVALAAIMLAHSTTADAVAWKASGFYHFWMDVEEIGFRGEAYLEYSGRLTPRLIEEGLNNEGAWFNFEIKHGLRGWERVNDGPWVPLIPPPGGFSPVVFLATEGFCNPAEEEDCTPPDPFFFLQPEGAWNWDGWGQFDFIRANGVGGYAQFEWDGTGYYCDWDHHNGTCEGGAGLYDFNYDYDYFGTFQEVPEPSLLALLGFGLFWLIASKLVASPRSAILIATERAPNRGRSVPSG